MDDRIKWLNGHTDEYLRILNEMNQQEEVDEIQGELTRAELEAKLKEAQERLARYEGYQKLMEETGASQLSITDADEKLMKNKNGFAVAYNAQIVVDSEDMVDCLENGIIPHAITDDRKDGYEI